MADKDSQAARILRRLRAEGELTNVQLNEEMHIYRYGGRIHELRKEGHHILSIHEKGGLWRFVLKDDDARCVVSNGSCQHVRQDEGGRSTVPEGLHRLSGAKVINGSLPFLAIDYLTPPSTEEPDLTVTVPNVPEQITLDLGEDAPKRRPAFF